MADEIPRLFTVDEAATALHCSRRRVFELLGNGTLARGMRYGSKTVVTFESVLAACNAEEPTPSIKRKRVRRSTRREAFNASLDDVAARARAGTL